MDNKVQVLADKIYKEGVKKASDEAQTILSEAQAKRDELLAAAQEQADKIVSDANRRAEELRAGTEAEMRIAAGQATEALKTEITDLINGEAVRCAVDAAFAKPETLLSIVVKMAEQWAKEGGVTISTPDARALESYISAHAVELLDKGIKVESVNGREHTFEISPNGSAYKVEVSREAFTEYFKDFMRPKLKALLFGKQDTQA